MEFSPANPIVQLYLRGMAYEEKGEIDEAGKIFLQAWDEAKDPFERFLAAYYVARTRKDVKEQLEWWKMALENAQNSKIELTGSAFPNLYERMAKAYEELGEKEKSKEYFDLSTKVKSIPGDKGPFYHGTRADLQVGGLLNPGNRSNYKEDLIMNHIYFTASPNGAGLAAALANGEGGQRVYVVEPMGDFENDPNVTDKKFPGNPTRSYRTAEPLKIVGELNEWAKLSDEEIRKWKDRLAKNEGEIIN